MTAEISQGQFSVQAWSVNRHARTDDERAFRGVAPTRLFLSPRTRPFPSTPMSSKPRSAVLHAARPRNSFVRTQSASDLNVRKPLTRPLTKQTSQLNLNVKSWCHTNRAKPLDQRNSSQAKSTNAYGEHKITCAFSHNNASSSTVNCKSRLNQRKSKNSSSSSSDEDISSSSDSSWLRYDVEASYVVRNRRAPPPAWAKQIIERVSSDAPRTRTDTLEGKLPGLDDFSSFPITKVNIYIFYFRYQLPLTLRGKCYK